MQSESRCTNLHLTTSRYAVWKEEVIDTNLHSTALQAALVKYLGVVGVGEENGKRVDAPPPWVGREDEVFRLNFAAGSTTAVADHIEDDTERAYVLIGFPSVNRWGQLKASGPGAVEIDLIGGKGLELVPDKIAGGKGGDYCKEMHVSRCMSVANDIISNRHVFSFFSVICARFSMYVGGKRHHPQQSR